MSMHKYEQGDPAKRRARRTDPSTSHEAAQAAGTLASRHHAAILRILHYAYPKAMAAEEIADGSEGVIDKVQIGKRLCELVASGDIIVTDQHHTNRTGRRAFKYVVLRVVHSAAP